MAGAPLWLLSLASCTPIANSGPVQPRACGWSAASALDALRLCQRAHTRIRGGYSSIDASADWRELHKAVGLGDIDLIEAIVSGGVSPDAADHNDFGPMHVAAVTGQEAAARALIAAGATIDARDAFGFSPMLWALFNGHLSLAAFLRQAKPAQASDRFDGLTPLMLAAASGDPALVSAMLPVQGQGTDGGSGPESSGPGGLAREGIGAYGLTPLDLARTLGHCSVERLLRERGVSATSLRPDAAPVDAPAGAREGSRVGRATAVEAEGGGEFEAASGAQGAEAAATQHRVGEGAGQPFQVREMNTGEGEGRLFEVRETSADDLELDPSIWDASIADSVPLLVHGFARRWSEPVRQFRPEELRRRWGDQPVHVAISPDERYQCHVPAGGTTVLRCPPWEQMSFGGFLDLIANQGAELTGGGWGGV